MLTLVQGKITNTQRIDAALPTIKYALDKGAKVRFECLQVLLRYCTAAVTDGGYLCSVCLDG